MSTPRLQSPLHSSPRPGAHRAPHAHRLPRAPRTPGAPGASSFFSPVLLLVFLATTLGLAAGCTSEGPVPEVDGEILSARDEGDEAFEPLASRMGEAGRRVASLAAIPGIAVPGSWEGELPCADCAGIRFQLTLEASGIFLLQQSYLGVPEARRMEGDTVFQSMGRWFVVGSDDPAVASGEVRLGTTDGSSLPIRLAGTGEDPRFLRPAAGGVLEVLPRDPALDRPASAETNNSREQNPILRLVDRPEAPFAPDARFQGRGGFAYFADSATFTECGGGVLLPVAMEGAYLELERAYMASGVEPASNLPVFVRGSIQAREPADPGTGRSQEWFLVLADSDPMPEGFGDRDCPALLARAAIEGGDPWILEGWRAPDAGPGAALVPLDLPAEGPGQAPSFQWDASEGRLTGSGGCNRFMGPGGLRGSQLIASNLASTMRYCEGIMELEGFFLQLLSSGPSLALGPDGALHLYDGPLLAARLVRGGGGADDR